MRRYLLSSTILRAPDGEGAGAGGGSGDAAAAAAAGAGGSGAGAGAGAGDGGAAAAAAAASAAAAAAYRPEGLPDHLYGKSDKETVDHLFKAFDGYRKGESQRTEKYGDVPKDATAYQVTVPDDIKPILGDLSKDPMFLQAQKDAHEIGMPAKVFDQFVGRWMKQMVNGGSFEAPYDPEKEREALIPAAQMPDVAERAKEVDRRSRDNIAWVKQLEARGMDKASIQHLTSGLDTAAGIKAVEWFRSQLRETTPALGGQAAGAMSASDLSARNADPRNDAMSPKFDRAFAAETTELYKRAHGSGPRT